MIVKKIKIENFGGIDCFESSFNPCFSCFWGADAQTVIRALGVIFKNSCALSRVKKSDIGKNTRIRAEAETDYAEAVFLLDGTVKECCAVNSFNNSPMPEIYTALHSNREEDELGIFYLDEKTAFSDKLRWYKDPRNYDSKRNLLIRTNGIGGTGTFRACLKKHIECYSVEPTTNCEIHLADDGRFTAENAVNMTDFERMNFEYRCFLNVNRFWQSVEKIRDLHHEACPLFVSGTAENAARAAAIAEALKQGNRDGRQVIAGIGIPK